MARATRNQAQFRRPVDPPRVYKDKPVWWLSRYPSATPTRKGPKA